MAIPRYTSSVTTSPVDLVTPIEQTGKNWTELGGTIRDAANKVDKYMTTADVASTTNNMKNQYSTNFQGQSTIDKANAAYHAYAKQTMAHTTLDNRPYTAAILGQNYATLSNSLEAQKIKYDKTQAALTLNDTTQTLTKSMEENAKKAPTIKSQDPKDNIYLAKALTDHAQIVSLQKTNALGGVISASTANSSINDATDKMHMQYVAGHYFQAKQLQQEDPEKYADAPQQVMKSLTNGQYDNTLRPDQIGKLKSTFKNIDWQFKTQSDVNKKNLADHKTNVLNQALVTGNVKPQEFGGIISADPLGAEDFIARKNAYLDAHNQIVAAGGSYQNLQALGSKFSMPLTTKEASSSSSFAIGEAHKAAASRVNEILRQAKTNSAALSENSNFVQQQIKDAKSLPGYVNQKDPGMRNLFLLQTTATANVNYQKTHGFKDNEISALSDSEAATLATRILNTPDQNNQLNPSVQAQNLIGTINSFAPADQPYVIKSMQKYLPGASQYLLKSDANPKTAYLTPLLALAYAKKIKDFGAIMTHEGLTLDDIKKQVVASPSYKKEIAMLQSKGGDPGPALRDFQKHAIKATLQFMESKNLGAGDAADLATQAQVGEATYHSFLTNGSTLKTPVNVGFTDLHNSMSFLLDNASKLGITLNPSVVAQYGKNPDTKTIEALTLNTAAFANNAMNNGIVLTDKAGSIVTDKNGSPYGLTFDQIRDPQFQQTLVTPYLQNLVVQKLSVAKKASDLSGILKENLDKIKNNPLTIQQYVDASDGGFKNLFLKYWNKPGTLATYFERKL